MYVRSERIEGENLPVLVGRTKTSCPQRTAAGDGDDLGFGMFVTPCDFEGFGWKSNHNLEIWLHCKNGM